MTADPAVEAAQRAIGKVQRSEPYRWAESGAREALAPLRELHFPVNQGDGVRFCSFCRSRDGLLAPWPTVTDRLIYPESEL